MSKSPLTLATGIFLVLAGSIWILQGLDVAFAPQSFMTDDRWWVLLGGFALVLGVFLAFRSFRR
jgi:peptidoglycan/LPS O-acetylase OafA/YrhL